MQAFHRNLIADHSECRAWFPEARWKKDAKLLARSLNYVVSHLEHPNALERFLHAVGAEHAARGVTVDHYRWAETALLAAMKEVVGARWTRQVSDEWSQAYRIIVDVMREGAAHRTTPTNVVTLPGADRAGIEGLLSSDVRDRIRASVQDVVRTMIQDEIRRVVDEELAALGPEDILKALKQTG